MNFVLVGTCRKALQHTRGRIAHHPRVTIHGELFNRSDGSVMEANDADGVLIRYRQDPIEFLSRQVFGGQDKSVGFVLLAHQARCAAWSRVWSHIRKDLKVILVDWDNPLRGMIQGIDNPYVDPGEFRRKVFESHQAFADLEDLFPAAFRVSPERLHQQWDDLREYLGLSFDRPPKPYYMRSLGRDIENYHDLHVALTNTPYFHYLEGKWTAQSLI